MKRIVTLMVVAVVALSFSMIAVAAEEKAAEKPAAEKAEKKDVKKDAKKDVKKDVKKDAKKDKKKEDKTKTGDAKPAAKGKKEVSGC